MEGHSDSSLILLGESFILTRDNTPFIDGYMKLPKVKFRLEGDAGEGPPLPQVKWNECGGENVGEVKGEEEVDVFGPNEVTHHKYMNKVGDIRNLQNLGPV